MLKQLENAKNLEEFIIIDNKVKNGRGWYYLDNALMYYNTGYEAVYTIPDWEKLRLEIIKNYEWVKTENDLLEAFGDAVSNYRLFSRG